jgi:hypothetical protein
MTLGFLEAPQDPGRLLDAPVDSAEAGWRPVYARGSTQVSDQARHALDP